MQYEISDLTNSWKWRIPKLGLTQKQFADLAGISPSSLSRTINHKSNPRYDFLVKVENALKDLEKGV